MPDHEQITAEYKFGNATVRIHGEVDMENLKAATVVYLKNVIALEKKKSKAAGANRGNIQSVDKENLQ